MSATTSLESWDAPRASSSVPAFLEHRDATFQFLPRQGVAVRPRPQLRRCLPQRRGTLLTTARMDHFLGLTATPAGCVARQGCAWTKSRPDCARGWFLPVTPGTKLTPWRARSPTTCTGRTIIGWGHRRACLRLRTVAFRRQPRVCSSVQNPELFEPPSAVWVLTG